MRSMTLPSWTKKLKTDTILQLRVVLAEYATTEYVNFFHNPQHHMPEFVWRDGVKEALARPDEEAIERLYEIADQEPYSWPTYEHPNFQFSMDMLDVVNWPSVLHQLRKELANEPA